MDAKHVRNLAICHGLCAGLIFLFGLASAAYPALLDWLIKQTPGSMSQVDRQQIETAKAIMLGYAVFFFLTTLLQLVACVCLAKRKGRVLCIVVACIELLVIPFGTILGVFTIITLVKPTVIEMFGQSSSS